MVFSAFFEMEYYKNKTKSFQQDGHFTQNVNKTDIKKPYDSQLQAAKLKISVIILAAAVSLL